MFDAIRSGEPVSANHLKHIVRLLEIELFPELDLHIEGSAVLHTSNGTNFAYFTPLQAFKTGLLRDTHLQEMYRNPVCAF